MRPLLIDLYCGAGGASVGYHRAGFDVIGVDLYPMPHYPFDFIQADALEFLDALTETKAHLLYEVAAIHASPPCQHWSSGSGYMRNRGKEYPQLIEITREKLKFCGIPYVIENVPQAPLINPVILCGSHFELTAELPGVGMVGLRRHRGFEANWPLPDPGPHDHSLKAVTVTGHGTTTGNRKTLGRNVLIHVMRELMEIDWCNRDELAEAIPPTYTEYVGKHLMHYLVTKENPLQFLAGEACDLDPYYYLL